MKIGVIGTGAIGQHHVRVCSALSGVELAGVADIREELVSKLAREHRTEAYTDYRELLKKDLDCVTVAVPTSLHREVAIAAMEHGLSVLVEKPIADTLENADAMIECARRAGVKLMVGHIERFNPAVMAVKREVEKGRFGRLVSISATRVGPFEPRVRDVGVILDLGVHDIDIMHHLYGQPVREVFATAGSVLHRFEDYATILLKFRNGSAGVIKTNWLTPHKMRRLSLTGTEGIAYVDSMKPGVQVYNGLAGVELSLEREEPLKKELEHFISCVRKDREPAITGEEGRLALQAALAAIASYKLGRVVEVASR